MRCRVRRRRNFVALVSGSVGLIVFVSTTCIHGYINGFQTALYVDLTRTTAENIGVENLTSHLYGKCFDYCAMFSLALVLFCLPYCYVSVFVVVVL